MHWVYSVLVNKCMNPESMSIIQTPVTSECVYGCLIVSDYNP